MTGWAVAGGRWTFVGFAFFVTLAVGGGIVAWAGFHPAAMIPVAILATSAALVTNRWYMRKQREVDQRIDATLVSPG